MKWFKRWRRPKVEAVVLPKLTDAYKKSEEIVKSLELINYMLADTQDWNNLQDQDKKHFIEECGKFYKLAHFQCSNFRDELMLAIQRLPNVRVYRK